jgi:rubrerythrin
MTQAEIRAELDRLSQPHLDPIGEMLASPIMREMMESAAMTREAIALRVMKRSATVAEGGRGVTLEVYRQSECEGKPAFESQRAAKKVADKSRKQGQRRLKAGAWPVSEYRCRFCGHWHVGSSRRVNVRRPKRPQLEMTEDV